MNETRRSARLGRIPNEPIAIVGIGCRFADARGPDAFWDIVRSGRNTVREVPDHRIELGYDIDYFYDPRPGIPGKVCSRLGGFLEHPELFDPAAFGLSPRDAIGMEPQQRLMVEVTWDALEDAGIVPESLHGERVAVIFGFMAEDYSRQRTGSLGEDHVFRSIDVFSATGFSHAVLSGRVSHLLGVTGPSLTLDTACSSSLYATHLACESLQRGESSMAIAGGVNLFLTPEGQIALSRSGMMSPDGKCKAFDADANGFVRAEGAGVVVLQPLEDALAQGNSVYAVIRGTGVSSDGRDGGHMMAPGRNGQAQAMRDAYARAGIDPADVQYVEAHGTGTVIGDPVEIAALADVLGPGRSPDRPLRVASVKGNLGHAESASGVAGLIKTALAIRHRELPAQMHFQHASSAIPWDEIPVRVQDRTTPWPGTGPALAGVNSFGISGTNAHVILESPPEPVHPGGRVGDVPDAVRPSLVSFSAHEPRALEEMIEATRDAARGGQPARVEDLGYTHGCRRSQRALRVAVVASSPAELADELDAHLEGTPSAAVRTGSVSGSGPAQLVMVFPGQGAQWLGMGRELLAREPGFAASIDRIDVAFARHVDWSLREVLEGGVGFDWRRRLDVLQPLLVAFEIALAELWASFGVRPDRVIGQSMGEIAAAHVAGCISLEDVARLACQRGRVVDRASGDGAMGIVALPSDEALARLAAHAGRIEIAGSNSPSTTIVSGDREAVGELLASLDADGIFARRLEVDFASHCFHMDPLLDDFRSRIEGIVPHDGSVPFVSTVDGVELPGAALDEGYWVRNLREPVSFTRAVGAAIEAGAGAGECGRESIFVEVSPHATLARSILEIAGERGATVSAFGSLQRGQGERRSLLGSLAALHVRGVPVDFGALHPDGRLVPIPLYPYQRRRYWFGDRNRSHSFRPVHPLLGEGRESAIDSRQCFFDIALDLDAAPFLDDLRVDGRRRLSGAVHLELARAAAEQLCPGTSVVLWDVVLRAPLELPADGRTRLQLVLTREGESRFGFRISSRSSARDEWQLCGRGRIACAREDERTDPQVPVPLAAGEGVATEPLAVPDHYRRLERQGMVLGRRLRIVKELRREPDAGARDETIVARLVLPRISESEWYAYHAHPALLESALQLLSELGTASSAGLRIASVARVRLVEPLPSECWCRVTSHRGSEAGSARSEEQGIEADLCFVDSEGRTLAVIEGLRAVPVVAGARVAQDPDLRAIGWVPRVRANAESEPGVRSWILVSDSEHEAAALGAELEKRGDRCLFCEKVEDLPGVRARLQRAGEAWGLVLLAWSDRGASPEQAAHRDFRVASWSAAIRECCGEAAEVWLATRGLERAAPGDQPPAALASAFGADLDVFASRSELGHCRIFDTSASLDPAERIALVSQMGTGPMDRRFAARRKDLFVARLTSADAAEVGVARRSAPVAPAGHRSFRVVPSGSEGAECVRLRESAVPKLAADDVLVSVRAASLSGLDVLTGLEMGRTGPGEVQALGRDFAGVVAAVGADVHEISVGDRVMGIADGAACRRLVVPVAQVVPIPDGLDFVEGAGLPFAFSVAGLALACGGGVGPGDRVLVRSAGGGVGLAAVSLARARGAEVHATAAREDRRRALRERGAQLLDARPGTTGFDRILAADGPASTAESLALLRPGGCYVDLNPRRDFELDPPGALDLDANRGYYALDFAGIAAADPTLVAEILREAAELVASGGARVLPATVFPVADAARALRFMTQNRHVGRVTLDFAAAESAPILALNTEARLPAGSAVVVVGEASALRDEVAARLRGASSGKATTRVEAVEPDGLDACLTALAAAKTDVAGWVHLGSAGHPLPERARRRMLDTTGGQPAWIALVSLRDADTDPCTWETQTWIDGLLLAGLADGPTRGFGLAVPRQAGAERICSLLDASVRTGSPGVWVALDPGELVACREGGARSALLQELEASQAGDGRGQLLRDEIVSQGGAEKLRSMKRFVADALATVLSLGERDRARLDLDLPFDQLGLDSLMMVELFLALARDLQLEIAREWFPPSPSPHVVAEVLVERIGRTAHAG